MSCCNALCRHLHWVGMIRLCKTEQGVACSPCRCILFYFHFMLWKWFRGDCCESLKCVCVCGVCGGVHLSCPMHTWWLFSTSKPQRSIWVKSTGWAEEKYSNKRNAWATSSIIRCTFKNPNMFLFVQVVPIKVICDSEKKKKKISPT